MTDRVVVLGAGYAGVGAVQSFQEAAPTETELVWVSKTDYHLVLHEVHRVIREPSAESKVTIPVDELAPEAEFVQGTVEGVDVEERTVELADGDSVDYDYLLVGIGSATAFYGIEGLREQSLTLKSLDDAREIHDAVRSAASDASRENPARVVVGGAGLSGIQCAGEVAGWRDDNDAPVEVALVEGLDRIFPNNDPEIQGALRARLTQADVEIHTGEFISAVDDETIYVGGGEDEDPTEMAYDVLVWTGGITGREAAANTDVDQDRRSHRIETATDFQTSDDRVFAVGDAALVDQDDNVAPPTAQAAWDAAEVAGENLARAVQGRPLRTWRHEDKGTLISVGHEAVAHQVKIPGLAAFLPRTFGGPAARALKKAVACRWIADISTPTRALKAWSDM
ncbi:MAG: NAD(P)/FAD-dependent oxidoreductase [Haloferacaceae archaeon]